MSTEFFNDQWRIPSNENQNKVSNYSMDFDGSSDSININSLASTLGSQGSFSAWVNVADWSSRVAILGFAFDADNFLRFGIRPNNNNCFCIGGQFNNVSHEVLSNTTSLSENVWYHVVATSDGSVYKLYINGQLQALTILAGSNNGNWVSDFSSTANKGTIGSLNRTGPSEDLFNGKIDQVNVFDYALSATQVSTLYGGGTAVTNPMTLSPKPISYYQLGDQSVDNGANYLVPNNSLSGSEGYSPYALDFDGVNDYLDTPQIDLGSTNTISFWINNSATNTGTIFGDPNAFGSTPYALVQSTSTSELTFRIGNNDNGYWRLAVSSGLLSDGNWHHHCLTRDGVTINYYIDGTLQTNVINNTLNASAGTTTTIEHIMANTTLASFASGKLSNVAVWNTNLSSTQVTEIYNEGVPSNLNNFSGTAPVSWWQLGSNSSFNTNWTCLDEIGTSNAVSANMTNSDIVDGVGYSASGLGTSSIDIKGDAPYSTANGLSENMDVLDRSTDVAPT